MITNRWKMKLPRLGIIELLTFKITNPIEEVLNFREDRVRKL